MFESLTDRLTHAFSRLRGAARLTERNVDEALEEVRTRTPRLVVLDVWLQGSGMDGLSLLKYLKFSR